jgi:hypothetical protein
VLEATLPQTFKARAHLVDIVAAAPLRRSRTRSRSMRMRATERAKWREKKWKIHARSGRACWPT